MTILDKIVTPAFVAFQAHCWFAYAVCVSIHTVWVFPASAVLAGVKEFVIDKNFETDQTFSDNLQDFLGYVTGIILAILAKRFAEV
jgi:hypothetical protein